MQRQVGRGTVYEPHTPNGLPLRAIPTTPVELSCEDLLMIYWVAAKEPKLNHYNKEALSFTIGGRCAVGPGFLK